MKFEQTYKKMERLFSYVRSNARFVLALVTNVAALSFSICWLWTSNFQIKAIISSLGLLATLLGLNYVNNKLSRPHLTVKLSLSLAKPHYGDFIHGISVTIENHSLIKAFIKNIQVMLPNTKQAITFLYEGFTGDALPKIILEPGQAFSFNIANRNLRGGPTEPSIYGDLVVTTDVGHKFVVPAKIFRDHLASLQKVSSRNA